MAKQDFFSNLKNKCPRDDDIQRTEEIIKKFVIKNGEEINKLYLESDVVLLADVFENFLKHLLNKRDLILYFVLVYQATLGNVELNILTLIYKHFKIKV